MNQESFRPLSEFRELQQYQGLFHPTTRSVLPDERAVGSDVGLGVKDEADIVHELVALVALMADVFWVPHKLKAESGDADETPA